MSADSIHRRQGHLRLQRQLADVYDYYKTTAESYANRGLRILKTDTHNESGIWGHSVPLAPILAQGNALTCIEIDPNTLKLAQERFPDLDLRQGDIQTWQGEYDVVLDFSTIDHVRDYRAVLENYKKLAPECSCIVWLHESFRQDGDQYWFPEHEFKQAFEDIFGKYESWAIYGPNIGILHHLVHKP